jgi:ATP-dependent 26S proteasome regulatory subunit
MSEMLDKMLVRSNVTFGDVGGMRDTVKQLKEMIEWPLKHKTIFNWLGVSPPKGILISGPPGTGKTLLAMAIAGSNPDIPFYKISGPEIVTGISG